MEIFLDGGLFEIIIAMVFGYAINYIFLKKYLLIIFSGIVILSPVALMFLKTGEMYNWLVTISISNALLLVVLLWKERIKSHQLFDIKKFKKNIFSSKNKAF
jgi:hypothetical protein